MGDARQSTAHLSAEAIAAIDEALADVRAEVIKAAGKFDGFNSAHEGYAVLKEEVDELWDEVKANRGYAESGMKEAVQVAAMAVRYITDLKP